MGFSMIRDAGALPLDDGNASIDPMGPVVWRGILLNVLNPKLTVFFFAFLPQFLDASPGLIDPKLIGLGGIFMLMTLVVFAVYALASAAIRDLVLAAPVARRWIERALGAFLIGFAARLALTDLVRMSRGPKPSSRRGTVHPDVKRELSPGKDRERAWQDSNLRHTAPETVASALGY